MSKTVTITKDVPVWLDCDVLVVGAGVSGFAAAVSAARAGVDVVLAEKNHYPGGVATSGLMCSMSNYFVTRQGAQVTTGLPIEFIDRLVSEYGAMGDYLRPAQPQIPNDPEVVKRVMIEMLREFRPQGFDQIIIPHDRPLDAFNGPLAASRFDCFIDSRNQTNAVVIPAGILLGQQIMSNRRPGQTVQADCIRSRIIEFAEIP